MATLKVTDTFEELTTHPLINVSYLRLFNIFQDDDGEYFLNIFRSYVINDDLLTDSVYFDTYEVENDDWWELISNKFYESVNLWWVPALANKVINPFEELDIGENLQMVKSSLIPVLVREIRDIGDM